MRFLAASIMRGRIQAISVATGFLLLSLVLPPFNIVSAATVVLVTLRLGLRDGLITIAAGAFGAALLGLIVIQSPGVVTGYALALWLPVWMFSVLLRESRRWEIMIEAALVLGMLAIAGVYLLGSDPASAWREHLSLALERLTENPPPGVEADQITSLIEPVSRFMTGIIVSGSFASLISAMLLGRWWQSVLYYPGGFKKEIASLKPHAAIGYAFLLIFVLAGFTDGKLAEAFRNLSVLGFFFYLILGTIILHGIVATWSAARILLPGLYIVLLFIPHALIPVALIGFTDHWVNWRGKSATS